MNLIRRVKRLFFKRKEYYFSRYYYRQLIDKYTASISIYVNLFQNSSNHTNLLKSNSIILSDSTITFNSTISLTKKYFGNPAYIIENQTIDDMCILFYRLKFADQRVKCEFHYYKNKIFYIKYIFSYLTENHKKSVIELIEGKYLNNEKFDYKNQIISDEMNTIIRINEDSHFNIDYISINSPFFNDIKNLKIKNDNRLKENELIFINQLSKKL